MCLIFRALFVLLVLILCGRGSGAFEDEITEPAAAMASSRISFLYTSFHVPGCPPRAPAASGRPRNCFSCLISHLWGKSRVLLKRQVVGQRLSVCFTRRHCRLLAAHSAICEVGGLHPNWCGRGISRWSQFLLSEWPPLLFHPQIATGNIITQRARENWIDRIVE